LYVSVTPSLTWMTFSDAFNSFQTSAGFGTRFALGKEWWVGGHWGVGLAGWFAFSFNKESDAGGPTWRTCAERGASPSPRPSTEAPPSTRPSTIAAWCTAR